MKKKIIKVILFILLIIFLSIIINNLREANIIYTFSRKLDEYSAINNFYAKYQENDKIKEIWRTENKSVTKYIFNEEENNLTYMDQDNIWILEEKKNGKGEIEKNAIKQKNNLNSLHGQLFNYTFYAENRLTSILQAIGCTITSENVNGYDCYKIYVDEELIIYVEKDTYIKRKEINCNNVDILLEYEFNCVSDEEMELLNFVGYKVKEVK